MRYQSLALVVVTVSCLVCDNVVASLVFRLNGPGPVSATAGSPVVIDVLAQLESDDFIQGLVMVGDVGGPASLTSLVYNPPPVNPLLDESIEAGPDTVVTLQESAFFVLGIVFDLDPSDNGGIQEILPPGTTDMMQLTLSGTAPAAGATETWSLNFVDGTYSADSAQVGPPLDNIVVIGGASVGSLEGLSLISYDVTVTGLAPEGDGAIPEPTTFAVWSLLGLTVGGVYRWRRRAT